MQFETIHPFLDGNGRVGRLLISLLLCHSRVMRDPFLYLSLYLKEHRATYYALLDAVRHDGDWEAWLTFFLEGVRQTAEGAVETAHELVSLFAEDRERIAPLRRRASSALRVHEALKARPLASMKDLCRRTHLSFPAASSAIETLVELSIAREVTGRPRNRIFAYDRYLEILSQGTEPTVTTVRASSPA